MIELVKAVLMSELGFSGVHVFGALMVGLISSILQPIFQLKGQMRCEFPQWQTKATYSAFILFPWNFTQFAI